ncbi:uncharacterized protein RJT20DRAFT_43696 [Scheffersomyces xylosifermentans]|uniref:uncharacterized protein n=1 Tax=Scheffersomyces xylosifermentans TaxID=1304137 RepID=UPI00315CA24C
MKRSSSVSIESSSLYTASNNSNNSNKSSKRLRLENEIFSKSIKDIEKMFTVDNFNKSNTITNNITSNANHIGSPINHGSVTSTILTSVNSANNHIIKKPVTATAAPIASKKAHCNCVLLEDNDIHHYLSNTNTSCNYMDLKYDCINLAFLSSAPSSVDQPKYANINDSCYFTKRPCNDQNLVIPILPSQAKTTTMQHSTPRNIFDLDMDITDVVDLEEEIDKLSFIIATKNNLERDLNLIDQLILRS